MAKSMDVIRRVTEILNEKLAAVIANQQAALELQRRQVEMMPEILSRKSLDY